MFTSAGNEIKMGIKHFFLNLMPSPLVWIFARPYVAGDSLKKALVKVDDLWNSYGFMSTVDLLGEDVNSKEEVELMVQIYHEVLDGLKDKSEYASISLKPTALGAPGRDSRLAGTRHRPCAVRNRRGGTPEVLA